MEASRHVPELIPSDRTAFAGTAVHVPAESGHGPSDWSDPDGAIDIWRGVRSIVLHWQWILGLTLAAAVLAAVLCQFLPRRYQALATAFVFPPMFSSALTPGSLSVEVYQQLANSGSVHSAVAEQMRKDAALPADGGDIGATKIILYPGRGGENMPVMGFSAEAANPLVAQRYVNAWVQIFVQEQARLSKLRKSGSVDFVLSEFPKVTEQLQEVQRRKKVLDEAQAKTLNEVERTIALKSRQDLLASRENLGLQLQQQLTLTRIDVRQQVDSVVQLEKELRQTPEVLVVHKGITDDALWQQTLSRPTGPTGTIDPSEKTIRTQEINPVHVDLSRQLATARVQQQSLSAKEEALVQQIRETSAEVATLREQISRGSLALDGLRREQSFEAQKYAREEQEAQAQFSKFQEKIGEARIARAEDDSELKIGALAQVPGGPSSPNVRFIVLLAMLATFTTCVGIAWVAAYLPKGLFRR